MAPLYAAIAGGAGVPPAELRPQQLGVSMLLPASFRSASGPISGGQWWRWRHLHRKCARPRRPLIASPAESTRAPRTAIAACLLSFRFLSFIFLVFVLPVCMCPRLGGQMAGRSQRAFSRPLLTSGLGFHDAQRARSSVALNLEIEANFFTLFAGKNGKK